ncbi:phosphopantetheine-binding protein [Burkholderia sp. Ac-20379]|uniref:phosphopantetheine-binding protein n=1 Tax=Burkholderia sp. Ac-20379 TaxID=2703900 RepID=UPI00197D6E39|nr:phosphopantetheine-binding protein [Burkholderia sp. Ac-20379]MBN3725607.1 acyl carrier protein [Burkholderia sp. Ac-20379]
MKTKIRDYIEENFLIEFDEDFPEDTDLFKAGIMDSFGYVQMCRFIEREFNIKFSEQDMTHNVLISVTRIEQFVEQKLAAQAHS